MYPYRTKILGENFLLESFIEDYENHKFSVPTDENITRVALFPSESADFGIKSYLKSGKTKRDPVSEALVVAEHLFLNRGLPLEEISIKTDIGEIRAQASDGRVFVSLPYKIAPVQKKRVTAYGCELLCRELTLGVYVRVIELETLDTLNDSVKALFIPGENLGSVTFFSHLDRCIVAQSYTQHVKEPPSKGTLAAAVAYALSFEGKYDMTLDGERVYIERDGYGIRVSL